jgi:ribosomal protein S18 acetylase RimI-like enzyme
MSPEIRPYRPADRDDVARVCLLTGASGGDATGMYSDDTIIPELAAVPYVEYAPELAYVVEDGGRALGYVVGVTDTEAFIQWWSREWAPGFTARHPRPGPSTQREPHIPEAVFLAAGAMPEMWLRIPELDAYPAHLHINLLPELQGRGFGRRLIELFRGALALRGVPALHLSVDPENVGARAFYERLGFHELASSTFEQPRFGIATAPDGR